MYKSYSELGVSPSENRDQYSILEVNDVQQQQKIIAENTIVCTYLYGHWCGPCKQTAPDFAVLVGELTRPGVAIFKKDYDKLPPQEKATIGGIPVYEFFVRGRKVDEVVGADLARVRQILTNLITTYLGGGNGGAYAGAQGGEMMGPSNPRSTIRSYRRPDGADNNQGGIPYQGGANPYHQPYGGGVPQQQY